MCMCFLRRILRLVFLSTTLRVAFCLCVKPVSMRFHSFDDVFHLHVLFQANKSDFDKKFCSWSHLKRRQKKTRNGLFSYTLTQSNQSRRVINIQFHIKLFIKLNMSWLLRRIDILNVEPKNLSIIQHFAIKNSHLSLKPHEGEKLPVQCLGHQIYFLILN